MIYRFNAYGHKNITSRHKTTVEFTKDKDISKEADCIIGVRANFSAKELMKFSKAKQIKITIIINGERAQILAVPYKAFSDKKEIVIRKSGFESQRTFAVKADKAAIDLPERLKDLLKNEMRYTVEIEGLSKGKQ